MVREGSNLLSLKNTDPEIYTGSFLEPNDLKNALSGCDIVLHIAACTSQSESNYKAYKTVNVDGTKRLLEESLKAGVKRFIFIGSANAFGSGSRENPGDENSPFTLIQNRSGYMRSKFEAQQIVLNFHQKHNFPAIVVNPTFMLGKYDSKPSSGQILLMAYKKWAICPPGGKNFIHVEDVANGIIQAFEKGNEGECYLLANENLSYQEFFNKMKTICSFPKRIIKLPKSFFINTGYTGSLIEKATGKPYKLNHINAQLLCMDNYYTPHKAAKELQLPQTPIEKAIKDALEWFAENGYLN